MAANNSDYIVRIMSTQTDNPILVIAPMPDSFMFDSQANYESPFAQGLFGGGVLSSLAKIGGLSLTSQALTAQIWQGSNDTQLGVELEFQAESDPISEVRNPILALMKLTTPSMSPGTGMIRSPGPQLDTSLAGQIFNDVKAAGVNVVTDTISILTDSNKATTDGNNNSTNKSSKTSLGQEQNWKRNIKNVISIQIGNYAFFDSVVITNVQKTYTSQIDVVTGLPMHARVAVQFKPLFLLLQDDLDNIFKTPGR